MKAFHKYLGVFLVASLGLHTSPVCYAQTSNPSDNQVLSQRIQVPSTEPVKTRSHNVSSDAFASMFSKEALPTWIQVALSSYLGFKLIKNLMGQEVLRDMDFPGQTKTYGELRRRLIEEIAFNSKYIERQNKLLFQQSETPREGRWVTTSIRLEVNPEIHSVTATPAMQTNLQPLTEEHVEQILRMAQAPDYQVLVIDDMVERKGQLFRMRPQGNHLEQPISSAELGNLRNFLSSRVGTTNPLVVTLENYSVDHFTSPDGVPRVLTNIVNLADIQTDVNNSKARLAQVRRANAAKRYRLLGGLIATNLLIMAYQHRHDLAGFGQDGLNAIDQN